MSAKKTKKGLRRPLLVFINPASGTKLAGKMFHTIVQPHLDERHLTYQALETEYAGHAEELVMSTKDLAQRYSGIVIISGDGLIHEVYNGLAKREDWDDICDIPVGIVPGGSGNALSCSLLRQLGQPLDGINNLGATWAGTNVAVGAAEDKSLPLDLLEVELANDAGQKHISFLGVTIGLIADCDIGSEVFRCLGYLRAYPLALWRIIIPKTYFARVSYLPLPKDPDTGKPIGVSSKEAKLELPSFSKPVPEDWVTIEDHFHLVYAINVSFLDPVTLLAPEALADDGILNLVLVRNTMSRLEMIQWFLQTNQGGHIGKTGVDIIAVRAFRIVPIEPRGYMTIDAENIDFGSSQGQILPGKGRLMVSSADNAGS